MWIPEAGGYGGFYDLSAHPPWEVPGWNFAQEKFVQDLGGSSEVGAT